MPLKQPSLSKAYSSLQCCMCSHSPVYATSTSPSVLPVPRARPDTSSKKRKKLTQWRSYATVKTKKTFDFRDNLSWPCNKANNGGSTPSPYDIFEIEQSGVYSKHKFYELVKMYHPDRHHVHSEVPDHPIASLSRLECLERYRLVVQAHQILSDPAKRRAYDVSGAGWGERATSTHNAKSRTYSAEGQDSPFGNATWEDWERWYARTSGKPGPQAYEGTYFNPNAFASFIILLAVISGVLQATRAGQFTGSIEERAAAFTAQTSQFMSDRKQINTKYTASGHTGHSFDTENSKSSSHSIRHFLERRDPYRFGLKDEEEEAYRRYFAAQSLSAPKTKDVRADGDADEA